MKTYCLALDLKGDPTLIEEYKRWHQPEHIWPEVVRHIRRQGVLREQIFLLGTRMVMVIETSEDFSFATKSANDQASPVMRQWESMMDGYQQPLAQAANGEKWVLMERIFDI